MKRALITGITGQDGSYLAEQLLDKGYEVHGIVRRSSRFNTERIDHLYRDPHEERRAAVPALRRPDGVVSRLVTPGLRDPARRDLPPRRAEPRPRLLRHARVHRRRHRHGHGPPARGDPRGAAWRRASTRRRRSEMFGAAPPPQSETTPFHPRSPYAVAKVAAYWITVNYREAYGMFASNGILFNHESPAPRRDVRDAQDHPRPGAHHAGLQEKLYLGNLDAKRDWGYAPDFTDAMWRMLQQDEPDDYVIATGEMHSVREFLDEAGAHLGHRLGGRRRDRPALLPPGRGRRAAAATRPRRARSSAGSRPSPSRSSCGSWSSRRQGARGPARGPRGAASDVT